MIKLVFGPFLRASMALLVQQNFAGCASDGQTIVYDDLSEGREEFHVLDPQALVPGNSEPKTKSIKQKPVENSDKRLMEEDRLTCCVRKILYPGDGCLSGYSEFLVTSQTIFDPTLSEDEKSCLASAFVPILYGVVEKYDGSENSKELLTFSSPMELMAGEQLLGVVLADESYKVHIPLTSFREGAISPHRFSRSDMNGALSLNVELRPIASLTDKSRSDKNSCATHSLRLAMGFSRSSHTTASAELRNKIERQVAQLVQVVEVAQKISDRYDGEGSCFFSRQLGWLTQVAESSDIFSALAEAVQHKKPDSMAALPSLPDASSQSLSGLADYSQYYLCSARLIQGRESLVQSYHESNVLASVEPLCSLQNPEGEGDMP